MSKRSDNEILALVNLLLDRLREGLPERSEIGYGAAGTTRLGKIETIKEQTDLKETLLIRVRQKRYSSIAYVERSFHPSASIVQIHVEHECGAARSVTVPFKQKRPNRVTLGAMEIQPRSRKWFSPL